MYCLLTSTRRLFVLTASQFVGTVIQRLCLTKIKPRNSEVMMFLPQTSKKNTTSSSREKSSPHFRAGEGFTRRCNISPAGEGFTRRCSISPAGEGFHAETQQPYPPLAKGFTRRRNNRIPRWRGGAKRRGWTSNQKEALPHHQHFEIKNIMAPRLQLFYNKTACKRCVDCKL